MSELDLNHEPPLDPLEDTNPSLSLRAVQLQDAALPGWRRTVGALSLLAAAGLTVATVLVLAAPATPAVIPATVPATMTSAPITLQPTLAPTDVGATGVVGESDILLPTLSAEDAAAILSAPLVPAAEQASYAIVRNPYDPFTTIPARPRNEVETYTIVEGDTIFSIAERFGLQPETIVWCNDNTIVHGLRPGREINIPPVDGVCYTVIGDVNTIALIAPQYGVTDPYLVIDAEYNRLFGTAPDSVLPSGTFVVVPGGQREQISWTPPVERTGGGANSNAGGFISFAPGEAGSCGRQPNDVSGTVWANPMNSYSFTQGFSSWHTGVDLAASVGAPVYAANSGRVIFAGWNSYGYGYTVVLATGPFTTLYGHLSDFNVRCGQVVSAGEVIGAVGSSGQSSGPHLHFEIRYLDTPTDPTATIGF